MDTGYIKRVMPAVVMLMLLMSVAAAFYHTDDPTQDTSAVDVSVTNESVALSESALLATENMVQSLSAATSDVSLRLRVSQQDGQTVAEPEVDGELTAEQETAWLDLQNELTALVDDSTGGEVEMVIQTPADDDESVQNESDNQSVNEQNESVQDGTENQTTDEQDETVVSAQNESDNQTVNEQNESVQDESDNQTATGAGNETTTTNETTTGAGNETVTGEQDTANETGADQQKLTADELTLKRFAEKLENAAFRTKVFLTFSQEAKLELLEQRNEQLMLRQAEWVSLKQAVTDGLYNTNAQEKQDVLEAIQAEHQDIIEEHLELTRQMQQLQAQGTLNASAQVLSAQLAQSRLARGLEIGSAELVSDITQSNAGAGGTEMDAESASLMVSTLFGVTVRDVAQETRDGTEVFVVSGSEQDTIEGYAVQQNFSVVVHAQSGIVLSAEFHTLIEGVDFVGGVLANESANETVTETGNETTTTNETTTGQDESEDQNVTAGSSVLNTGDVEVSITQTSVELSQSAVIAIENLAQSLSSAEEDISLRLHVFEQDDQAVAEPEVDGTLTAEQEALWVSVQQEIVVLVNSTGGEVEMEITTPAEEDEEDNSTDGNESNESAAGNDSDVVNGSNVSVNSTSDVSVEGDGENGSVFVTIRNAVTAAVGAATNVVVNIVNDVQTTVGG